MNKEKKENKPLKIATAFSGIGAAEQALKQLGIKHEIIFACDNGERYLHLTQEDIEKIILEKKAENPDLEIRDIIKEIYDTYSLKANLVKKSYFANYDIDENRWFEDVRFLDGNKYAGEVDLFVGGSPCQSFSTYGHRRGLEDTRGTLFYDYARLVKEVKPKVFIYENVRGLLSHDKGKTWKIMQDVFSSLNYSFKFKVLDAQNYGIPQMRKRIFVVGFRNDIKHKDFEFPQPEVLKHFVPEYLDSFVPDEYYLPEKGFKWVTEWKRNQGKARVNRDIMGCQTAVQQVNWSGDFRIEVPQERHYQNPNIYIGQYQGHDAVARKLTPRECLRLMGFNDFKIVNDDKTIYRQSGNSIAVPVIKKIIEQINNALSLEGEDVDEK